MARLSVTTAALAAAAAAAALSAPALASRGPEDGVIRPGQPWYDSSGNRIYAGGANLYEEAGTYYMVGEGKKVLGADCSECFNLYKTTDLQNWDYVGCVLNNSNIVAPAPYANEPFYRMERPKIFKCPSDGTYRMWFHCDTSGFDMRSVGVLTADNVEGPYTFASPCFRPDGQDSFDMGTYYDDISMGGDGHNYLIRSVRNTYAGISAMTVDCLNVTGIVSQGPDMEGQAIMRDTNGTLHAAGSHLTGWAANAAQFVTSPNATLVGAQWVDNINPSGDPTTYDSQSTFIFPFRHASGKVTYIWMADRWNANGPGGLDNMTNIWLPLLPPTGGPAPPAPQAGWLLSLATCNASDPAQLFQMPASGGGVVNVKSGLCVAQPSDTASVNLVLTACAPGSAPQTWYRTGQCGAGGGGIASTPSGTASGCVNFNVANQDFVIGNPIMPFACGGANPAPNACWLPPAPGAAGVIKAVAESGEPSGLCAAVAPAQDPSQWHLPWFDAWSLSQFA